MRTKLHCYMKKAKSFRKSKLVLDINQMFKNKMETLQVPEESVAAYLHRLEVCKI